MKEERISDRQREDDEEKIDVQELLFKYIKLLKKVIITNIHKNININNILIYNTIKYISLQLDIL